MAREVEGNIASREAGEDLSSSQYYIVKLSSGTVVKSSAATDKHLGVVRNKPTSGATASIFLRSAAGTGKVKAGGTISAGQKITSDANGKAVVSTSNGDEIIGMAVEDAVLNDVFEFMPSTSQLVS